MESARSSKSKSLGLLLVIALIALIFIIDMKRRAAEAQLQQLSMQLEQVTGGNQQQNREAAREIVEKVRELYALPEGIEPTVATIVDVNVLRQRNAFYEKAKNGDHLIVTNDRAILYDPVRNMIIDVVPVQIQAAADTGSTDQ
jgi:hypothetical protein